MKNIKGNMPRITLLHYKKAYFQGGPYTHKEEHTFVKKT